MWTLQITLAMIGLGGALVLTVAGLRERQLGARFWLALLGAFLALVALHASATPFLSDIRPGFGGHRISPVWHVQVGWIGLPPVIERLAFLNIGFALLTLLPVVALLLDAVEEYKAGLTVLAFLVFNAVFVKFSAGSGPQSLMALTFFLAAERAVAWRQRHSTRDLLLVAILLGVAANLRPEGPLLAVALVPAADLRWRDRPGLRDLALAAVPFLLLAAGPLQSAAREIANSTYGIPWLNANPLAHVAFPFVASSRFIPTGNPFVGLALAATTVVLFLAKGWDRPLLRFGLASALASLGLTSDFGADDTNHRYVFVALACQALFIGRIAQLTAWELADWLAARRGWRVGWTSTALPALTLAGIFVPTSPMLPLEWEHTDEYRLLSSAIPKLPADTTVLYDLTLYRETGLSLIDLQIDHLFGVHQRWLGFGHPEAWTPRDEYYLYLGASCYLRQKDGQGGLPPERFHGMSPSCSTALQKARATGDLVPVAEAASTGGSIVRCTPTKRPIPLVLYRVTRREAGT